MSTLVNRLRALARSEQEDSPVIAEAADEIERLRGEVGRLMADEQAMAEAHRRAIKERNAMLARVEAAERDAGRYRWLRNESLHRLIRGPICIDADTWGEPVMACGKHITLDGATLDADIDAMREGGK